MKKPPRRVTNVRHFQSEAGATVRNGHVYHLRELSPRRIAEEAVFRVEEHLGVQHQIERRAHALWCAGGCRHGTALSDWLQAEHEVVGQFVEACLWRHASPQSKCLFHFRE